MTHKINNYYSGGLAEIISTPSPTTYEFIKKWFTGSEAIGGAMRKLGLPYRNIDICILEMRGDALVVNLNSEEQTLYKNTIFTYAHQPSIHSVPHLKTSWLKILNPICLFNTMKILIIQSVWISSPEKTLVKMEDLVEKMPAVSKDFDRDKTSKVLGESVWPVVIAVGLVSEFYNQLLQKEARDSFQKINAYISREVARDDWFFGSLRDQEKVKKEEMSLDVFLSKYGIRADKDYELISPRWHEIPEKIRARIEKDHFPQETKEDTEIVIDKKFDRLVSVNIGLQMLRSEVKRRTLEHIDHLRGEILKDKIIPDQESFKLKKNVNEDANSQRPKIAGNSHQGTSISRGMVRGKALIVTESFAQIPNGTIGIFPNASTEFTMQFPKCKGMIFLRGGQTSHGAIVAREFGIPAIVDEKAGGVRNGTHIELNGSTGEWKELS